MTRVRFEARYPCEAEDLYAWHARPGAFTRLIPPWQPIRLLSGEAGIEDGTKLSFMLSRGPIDHPWTAVISDNQRGRQFRDTMERGPFRSWTHLHRFEDLAAGALGIDEIDYELPLGAVGNWVAGGRVARELKRVFAYRRRRLQDDIARHSEQSHRSRLKVAISGAGGLIGSALEAFLSTGGHTVLRLVRRRPNGPNELSWDPIRGELDGAALQTVDAVVHLAGESLAGWRWSASKKRRILESRTQSTAFLAQSIAKLSSPPRVLISASAIGFYGDRGDPVDEGSGTGTGFLAEVTRAWEQAAEPARLAGVRVVHPRIGVVLAAQGGALPKMARAFRCGLGGAIGNGRQGISWIALDDLIGVLHRALFDEALSGPVNCVAPHPVEQREFAKILAAILKRPAILPLPAFAVRALLGEMGQGLLLDGAIVRGTRLAESQFPFLFPELGQALRAELGL